MLKLYIMMHYHIVKQHLEIRAKDKWYYNHLPRAVSRAFTLAEILVTLTVIGVVASLTIPSLVNNIGDQQNRVAWKKAFADISNATRMIMATKGAINFTNSSTLRNDYADVMQVIKQDTAANIFEQSYYGYKSSVKISNFPGFNNPSTVLSNGSFLLFNSYGNGGDGNGKWGFIYVDVNGKSGPNMWGKDLYDVWIVKSNGDYLIKPMGTSPTDGYSCVAGSTVNNTSEGCSALALTDQSMP